MFSKISTKLTKKGTIVFVLILFKFSSTLQKHVTGVLGGKSTFKGLWGEYVCLSQCYMYNRGPTFLQCVLSNVSQNCKLERMQNCNICEWNMCVCHKATCITETATNSCHITHKQMDSSKETFCGLQYLMIFCLSNSLTSKNIAERETLESIGPKS